MEDCAAAVAGALDGDGEGCVDGDVVKEEYVASACVPEGDADGLSGVGGEVELLLGVVDGVGGRGVEVLEEVEAGGVGAGGGEVDAVVFAFEEVAGGVPAEEDVMVGRELQGGGDDPVVGAEVGEGVSVLGDSGE